MHLFLVGSLIELPSELRPNWEDRPIMANETDLNVEWANLETEFWD